MKKITLFALLITLSLSVYSCVEDDSMDEAIAKKELSASTGEEDGQTPEGEDE